MTLGMLTGRVREVGAPILTHEVVVALDTPKGEGIGSQRFQRRTIRSVGAGGEFTVRYQTGVRDDGSRRYPAELKEIVPKGAMFAYDVVEQVVRLRYLELRQREEIRTALAEGGVRISTGSVSNLMREGIAGLELLHQERAPALAEHYRKTAFVLHLDGTREGGEWAHFVMRESMSGHVLMARKIRTEHSTDIGDMLEEFKRCFGSPDCIVSDLSSAIAKAIEEVFPDVPHRLCHYHFLKAAGKSILGTTYDSLGSSVRRTTKTLKGIRRRATELLRQNKEHSRGVIDLIDRIISYTGDLKAEGFPFDLPHLHFYERCEEAQPSLLEMLNSGVGAYGPKDAVVACLRDLREALRRQVELLPRNPVAQLRKQYEIFAELRDILRPVTEDARGEKAPLNWGMLGDAEPCDIAGPLAKFKAKARKMARRKYLSTGYRQIWKALDRQMQAYAEKLNPMMTVREQRVLVPRTNNINEVGFRDFKRQQRRTTGNGNLSRQLDHTPAQAFYAANLEDPQYCRIVFSNRSMLEALADVERKDVMRRVAEMKSPPAKGIIDHDFIHRDDFFAEVVRRFKDTTAQKAS